ncbi:MAG: SMP-30/gluconolactonase/LRE family protein [Alphaproteobacteria bacterium]
MAQKPECILEAGCWLGEGPCWDARDQCLYWTDIPSRRLHRWSAADGHAVWPVPNMVTALAPRRAGGLIVAELHGLAFFDPASGTLRPFVAPEADRPRNRSNDGGCDRQGRFWYGTMSNNLAEDGGPIEMEGSTGALYRVDPDGSWRAMATGIGISNTFAWTADDRTFYFADTLAGIYAYDFDPAAGTVADRRPFAMQDRPDLADRGHPDGSTIDCEGFLWNCRWDGGCVIRFAPDGSIDRVVELPCSRVTSAAFGGPDLDTLYITTVTYGMDAGERAAQPLAGGLFAYDPGVRGLPQGVFAG